MMIRIELTEPLIQNVKMETPSRLSEPAFNLTPFTNQRGLYYESHGQVKLSSITWDLITYVNLQEQTSEYKQLMSHYYETAQICKNIDKTNNLDISNTCELLIQQFTQATLPLLHQIESNQRSLMLVIGHDQSERPRRGLGHTVRRMANALYGMCSKIDTGFIIDKLIELGMSKLGNLNLIQDRTRIMKSEISEESHVLQQITENQNKVKENLRYLQQELNRHTQNIDTITFKTKLFEQEVLFEILLNKYIFETQNLISIVNSALDGKVHTNVLSSQKLLMELREIKMILPMGSELPIEINVEALSELLRISGISIFIQNNYLVFVIEIPLISREEYNVYHPIPLPIQFDDDAIVLIAPEIDYLAISSDNEKFFILTAEQWKTCIILKQGKLCTTSQPIHHRLGSHLCEVSLLTTHQSIPETCNLKYIMCDKPIWHRLSESNSWIYFTQLDLGTIICSNPTETIKVEMSGVGRLTIPSSCEIHIDNSIFTPINKVNRHIQLDIVPETSRNFLLPLLTDILKGIKPQNFTNISFIKDLNNLANKAMEIKKLPQVSSETMLELRIQYYVICILIVLAIIILSFCIVILKIKNTFMCFTKIYKPDIPVAQTDGMKEETQM